MEQLPNDYEFVELDPTEQHETEVAVQNLVEEVQNTGVRHYTADQWRDRQAQLDFEESRRSSNSW